jgi:arginine exporter protein ArgO
MGMGRKTKIKESYLRRHETDLEYLEKIVVEYVNPKSYIVCIAKQFYTGNDQMIQSKIKKPSFVQNTSRKSCLWFSDLCISGGEIYIGTL